MTGFPVKGFDSLTRFATLPPAVPPRERYWPAGSAMRKFCVRVIPYGEVDPSPTKDTIMNESKHAKFASLAFGKQPAEELYRLSDDPHQLRNLIQFKEFQKIRALLQKKLDNHLKWTKDLRLTGKASLWDYYPYYRAPKIPRWKVAPVPHEI